MAVVVIMVITVAFAIKPPALIGVINNFTIAGGACAFFHAGALRRMVETGEQIWLYRLHGCGNRILFAFNGSTGVEFFGMLPLIPSLVFSCAAMIFGSLLTPAPGSEVLDVWFGVGRTCCKPSSAKIEA